MMSSSLACALFRKCIATGNTSVKTLANHVVRVFSSLPPNGPQRSAPQYTIFAEKTMLSIKMIPPTLRCLRNGSLVLDNNKKGRLLLEWAPKNDGGGFDRDSQIRFGLSAEEVGFLLHQLPDNPVEFTRRLPAETPGISAGDMPEKILSITPGDGGQFSFKIDFVKDGVGGQSPGTAEALGPLEVVVQLGEFAVLRELFQRIIPSLLGWDVQLNFAMQNVVNMALANQGAVSSSAGGRQPRPASSPEESSDVPF